MSQPTYVLITLGELSLRRVDGTANDLAGQTRPLLLLALLAQSPRLSGRRDHLAQLLWADSDVTRARRSLRQALFRLTKNAPELIIRDGERLTLNRDAIQADCWELEGALKRHDYARAIELYKGPFLAGAERKISAELEHWIESQNSHINQGVELAFAKSVDDAIRNGDTTAAVEHAREFASLNPLDEAAQTMLVRALRADGDEVAALGAYQAYRTLLDRELGDTPSPEWSERMERVRKEVFAPVMEYVTPAVDRRAIDVGPAPRTRSARLLVLPIGAFVVAILGIVASISLRSRPTGPLADLSARVLVSIVGGADTTVAVTDLNGSIVDSETTSDIRSRVVPSPDNRWYAFANAAADGWNLNVREVDEGSALQLTEAAEDEFPVAWSPDSRLLVYARRRLNPDGRSYTHDLNVVDVSTRQSRRLGNGLNSITTPSASWSPDGTQIVFTAAGQGASDIFVAYSDGSGVRNITRNDVVDLDPTWSPDRERIAFVSRRTDHAELMIMRPDGTDLRRVAQLDRDVKAPQWLNDRVILVLIGAESGGDLWAVDVFSGQTQQMTYRGDVVHFSAVLGDRKDRTWIEQVAIQPKPNLTSPGQFTNLGLIGLNQEGDTVPVATVPVIWSVDDPSVATFVGPGQLYTLRPGDFQVTATIAGWRTDTLSVRSAPVVVQPDEPLASESWTTPLDRGTWTTFGEPAPRVERRGSPTGGVFINNGDAFFESGVVLRRAVALDSGVTLETYGKLPFTGRLHQTFGISLRRELPSDSVELGPNGFVVDFRIQGPSADEPGKAWIATSEGRESVPLPRAPNAWHEYAIQLYPDGSIDILIDQRMHWRSTLRARFREARTDSAFVTLGYRSFQTDIAHGPVSVYHGIRYRLAPGDPAVMLR